MNNDQIILLTILSSLLLLLVWGKVRYDIAALGALFVAALCGLIPQEALFSGFGNVATITVVLVLIVSYGLARSGAVEFIVAALEPVSTRPLLHIAILTFLAAFLSMFMNNIGALALLMPLAIQSTRDAGRSPATVLMPLSFGSILGGLVTQIGTPPNILVSGYRQEVIGEGFTMFDYAPVGGGVALCGILFMLLLGWRFVRVRKTPIDTEMLGVDEYLFELKITEESEWVGKTAATLKKKLKEQGLDLLMLLHKKQRLTQVQKIELARSDVLVLQGSHEDINDFATSEKLMLIPADSVTRKILHSEDTRIMEVVISPQSSLIGRTPADVRFNRRYDINLLAISRAGTEHRYRLRQFKFKQGDVLLFHGDDDSLSDALPKLNCYPLAKRNLNIGLGNKALLALATFIVAITLTAFGYLSIQLALGLATVVMVLLRVVPLREFYKGVDWPVVVLLGAMIPLGAAFETTGTSALLVQGIVGLAGDVSPVLIIAIILIVTMTVSDILNNAATAILMLPIAYNTAISLNLNPDAFLMAVAVGASCAFLTPVGHQNNMLIMGPGGYKFRDYWRVGLPLEIVIVAVSIPLLLYIWPIY
ncbi:MAG: SLC13 family permease [Pseudohongiellaceae bacterium]